MSGKVSFERSSLGARPHVGLLAGVAVLAVLAIGSASFVAAAFAEAQQGAALKLQVGDALPPLALQDQNAKSVTVDAATKILLFTRDMDAGAIVKEALAEDGAALLAAGGAVYVSDVSGMPGLVRSMFALPALRRRPYAVGLDEAGEATANLPSEAGKVTILRLDSGSIASISFPATSAQLRAALGE
ncbi:MAG: hypothetical protein ABR538_13870 [Candidatus Binatia bacterium]